MHDSLDKRWSIYTPRTSLVSTCYVRFGPQTGVSTPGAACPAMRLLSANADTGSSCFLPDFPELEHAGPHPRIQRLRSGITRYGPGLPARAKAFAAAGVNIRTVGGVAMTLPASHTALRLAPRLRAVPVLDQPRARRSTHIPAGHSSRCAAAEMPTAISPNRVGRIEPNTKVMPSTKPNRYSAR